MSQTMQPVYHEIPPAPFYPNGPHRLMVIVFTVDYGTQEFFIRVEPVAWGTTTWWMRRKGYTEFPFNENVIRMFCRTMFHGLSKIFYQHDERRFGKERGLFKMNATIGVSVDEMTWEAIKSFANREKLDPRDQALLRDIQENVEAMGNVAFATHVPVLNATPSMFAVFPGDFLTGALDLYRRIVDNEREVKGYARDETAGFGWYKE